MNKILFWINLTLLSFFFLITKKFGFATIYDNWEIKGKLWILITIFCTIYIYNTIKPSLDTVYLVFNIVSVIIFFILIGFFVKGAEEFVIIKGYLSIVKYASHEEKVELLCNLMLQESKLRPNFIDKFVRLDDLTLLQFKNIIHESRTLREVELKFNNFVYFNFGPRPNLLLYQFVVGLFGVFLGTMWFIVIYFVF